MVNHVAHAHRTERNRLRLNGHDRIAATKRPVRSQSRFIDGVQLPLEFLNIRVEFIQQRLATC